MKKLLAGLVIGFVSGGISASEVYAFAKKRPDPEPVPTSSPAPVPPAGPALKLGEIGIAGSGCTPGTATVELSEDQKKVRVHFTDYGGVVTDSKKLIRKNCTLAIPVLDVGEDKKVVVKGAEILGAYELSALQTAQVSSEIFIAGGNSGQIVQETYGSDEGGKVGAVLLQHDADTLPLGECGKDSVVRANTSLLIKQASSALGSAWTQSQGEVKLTEVVIDLALESCE